MRYSAKKPLMLARIGAAFAPIAHAAKAASDVDRAAVEHIIRALDMLAQWGRDTQETTRRHAYGAACAAHALATSSALPPATMSGVVTRRALAAYAAALVKAGDNEIDEALRAAMGASYALQQKPQAA